MKRALCLLLAVLVLAVTLLLPVSGAGSLSFIAVNDKIPLTLTGDMRPFYAGGTLYVPYTAFNAPSLGFYPSYSAVDQTLTLFSRDQRLVFNLADGTVTDEKKAVQVVATGSKAGTIFLPAVFCAGHFGVQVSELTSQGGYPIVRFTTGSEVYDDGLFVEKAEILIAYRVAQSLAPPAPVTPPKPTAPITPAAPAPTAPDEQEPARIYLAVTGGALAENLAVLDQYHCKATFFLTAQEIAENGALVRRLAAEGHYLGLRADGTEDPAGQLAAADTALLQALQTRSLLALLPAGWDASALRAHYRVFSQPSTRLTATEAVRAAGEARLVICDAENLSTSLQILTGADCQFLPLRETTQPETA